MGKIVDWVFGKEKPEVNEDLWSMYAPVPKYRINPMGIGWDAQVDVKTNNATVQEIHDAFDSAAEKLLKSASKLPIH